MSPAAYEQILEILGAAPDEGLIAAATRVVGEREDFRWRTHVAEGDVSELRAHHDAARDEIEAVRAELHAGPDDNSSTIARKLAARVRELEQLLGAELIRSSALRAELDAERADRMDDWMLGLADPRVLSQRIRRGVWARVKAWAGVA